jgi:uncharacterized protein YjbJ (UPF0337 family)
MKGPFENLTGKIKQIAGKVAGHHDAAAGGKDRDRHAAEPRQELDRAEESPCQCLTCQHYRPWFRGRTTCDAYPDDIPVEILWNRIDHCTPYVGDHDIRYEAIEPEADLEDELEDGIGTQHHGVTSDPR